MSLERLGIQTGVLRVLLLSRLLSAGAYAENVDDTLQRAVSGQNVVVTVLEKIEASKVFHEQASDWFYMNTQRAKSFLRVLAYIRSNDGRRDSIGGIWNISVDEFMTTKYHVASDSNAMLNERLKSHKYAQVDWLNVSYDNMTTPMYSGLAAMLLMDETMGIENPSILARPSDLWIKHFGGTNVGDWHSAKDQLNHEYGTWGI